MKRILLLTASLAIAAFGAVLAKNNSQPDFAFPDTVATEAETQINQAIRDNDGNALVKALIDFSLARNSISPDYLPPAIARIDSIAASETSAETKSLLRLLQAEMYAAIYSADKWKYDKREVPLDPLPDDCRQWSGELFRIRVYNLLRQAVSSPELLVKSPLTDWTDIITSTPDSRKLYPTLFDFIAYRAINVYTRFNTANNVVPARYQTPAGYLSPFPLQARINESTRAIHDLYLLLVKLHADNPAPRIFAEVNAAKALSESKYEVPNEIFLDIFNTNRSTPWRALALEELSLPTDTLYPLIKQFVDSNPDYLYINRLRNRLTAMTNPKANLKLPSVIPPDRSIDVKLTIKNTHNFDLRFRHKASGKVFSFPMTIDRPAPYTCDTTLAITLPLSGEYTCETVLDGKTESNYYQITRVSRIGALTANADSCGWVFAVDPMTGAPLSDINVAYRPDITILFKKAGRTAADGAATYHVDPRGSTYLRLTTAEDSTYFSTYNYYRTSNSEPFIKGSILTDLSLYHPGDTLRWALMAYCADPSKYSRTPAAGIEVEVTIEDDNLETIFTDTVTTDSSGRAQGLCRLPLDGLSGQYEITVQELEDYETIAQTSVMVNDYKLPTFEVTATDIRRSTLPDSLVTVTFQAKAYSGFPIADAAVTLDLIDIAQSYFSDSNIFWSTSAATDSQGNVSLTIPESIFDLSPTTWRDFSLRATITSPSGETQSQSTSFSLGKPYSIYIKAPYNINLDEPTPIIADAHDVNGKPVKIDLKAVLKAADNTSTPISLGQPLPRSLQPGLYTIEVMAADSTLADTATQQTTLFANKGKCPFDKLTIPIDHIGSKSGKATITYGVPFDDANLLLLEMVDTLMTSHRWIKQDAGMHTLQVDVPASARQVQVTIQSYHHAQSYSASAIITNTDYLSSLTVDIETFRDKVSPGDKETITLRFKDKDGCPVSAYAMLGMSSSALNKLNYHMWNISPYTWRFPSLDTHSTFFLNYINCSNPIKNLPTVSFASPAFDLYGLSFSPYTYRNRMYKIRGLAANTSDEGLNCVKEYCSDVVVKADDEVFEEVERKGYTVTSSSVTVAGYGSSESEEEEAEADSPIVASPAYDNFKYRPSEIPLAFFEPMLSSDADGRLTYTYTVPDANTSWQFDVAAYTPEIVVGTLERTVVASRPVMVQTNSTRFLRYGDHATLKASVMNTADTAVQAVTTLTIVDASTLATLATHVSTDTIAPLGSAVVSIPFSVTTEMPGAIIYRVKTSAGRHTDGEQTLIPILPASQPVIVSTPFFIPASADSARIDVEPAPSGAKSTLYLYDNPLWEVVTALPSIADGSPTTSVAAAAQLYKSAIARGLMQAYPAVRTGLREWLESDRSDSTLVAQLQRNDDLKQLSLKATPWVRQAMSESERLTSLALMLDDSNIETSIQQAVKTLESLAQPDGGFAWTPGYDQTSEWATYRVLNLFALLKTNNYLPGSDRLDSLIRRALEYTDKKAADDYRKWGENADFTDYIMLRSLLPPARQTATLKTITRLTVNKILNRWSTEPITYRATDAIILSRNGYPTMARRLISSIVASSMSSPEKGMWWSRLETGLIAFVLKSIEMVNPSDRKTIDAVAQWLILAKTAQDWGNSIATSSVVNALIDAIPADKAATATTTVTFNDKAIVSDTPQLPGMTVSDISGLITGGHNTLSIVKPTGLPAMGSVITCSISDFDSIAQHSNPSIAISKRINVVSGTGVVEADSLKVGDRIRVQLIFTVTDPLDYVTVIDRNAACLEPVDQLSGSRRQDGMWFYRETTDTENRMFIAHLPVGTYIIDYEMYVMAEGSFSSGVATLQSQLNPAIDANSSARRIIVTP